MSFHLGTKVSTFLNTCSFLILNSSFFLYPSKQSLNGLSYHISIKMLAALMYLIADF